MGLRVWKTLPLLIWPLEFGHMVPFTISLCALKFFCVFGEWLVTVAERTHSVGTRDLPQGAGEGLGLVCGRVIPGRLLRGWLGSRFRPLRKGVTLTGILSLPSGEEGGPGAGVVAPTGQEPLVL